MVACFRRAGIGTLCLLMTVTSTGGGSNDPTSFLKSVERRYRVRTGHRNVEQTDEWGSVTRRMRLPMSSTLIHCVRFP